MDNVRVKKLIYISHPSSGLESNTMDVEKIIRKLYSDEYIFQNYCIVSPIHTYGYMYNDVAYDRGLAYCTDLMYFCDEVWVFGNWKSSTGCTKEIELANKLGIKVRILGYSSDIDKVIKQRLYEVDDYANTPSQIRKIQRNERAFVCVTNKEFESFEAELPALLYTKVLYDNINSALTKAKDKKPNESYVLLEVELDGNVILDIDDNDVAYQFKSFYELEENKFRDVGSKSKEDFILEKYARTRERYAVKRFIPGKETISEMSNIKLNNREAYQIFDSKAIIKIKVYNNYIIDMNKNKNRSFTFGKSDL